LQGAAWLAARQRLLSDAEKFGEKVSLDHLVGQRRAWIGAGAVGAPAQQLS
jgi:hypothetical protein